jgi:hypothetical protein
MVLKIDDDDDDDDNLLQKMARHKGTPLPLQEISP